MGPTLSKVLYDDGSLLDLWARPLTVRSLTDAGLELVVRRLRDSGSFTKSHVIPTKPINSDFAIFTLTLFVDGAPITVDGTNTGDDAETRTVFALINGLLEPATWLPASAFRGGDSRPHPYLATRSRVTTEAIPLAPSDRTSPERSIDRIAWPLPTPPEHLGDLLAIPNQPARSIRCALVDGAGAASINSALAGLPPPDELVDLTSGWHLTLPGPALLELTMRPFLPDEAAVCDPTTMPNPPSRLDATQPTLVDLLVAGADGMTPKDAAAYLEVNVARAYDGDIAHVTYYRDGTILFRDPPPPAVAIGARRLSSDGIGRLQRAIDETGLLRSSHEFWGTGGAFEYTVQSGSTSLFATDRDTDPTAMAIVAFARHLADPVAWLPSSAWIGDPTAIVPFRPSSVEVVIESDELCVSKASPLPTTQLQWPLAGTISTFGEPDPEAPCHRRGTLSPANALLLLSALAATGTQPWNSGLTANYEIATQTPETIIGFHLWISQ
jgi:hypothetical protein